LNLHKNTEVFKDAILAASQRFGIPEIYVEKDYWITLVLHAIFHSDIADQVVFKGGTCLSKCLQLIRRFSEDIDLVVLRAGAETDNQLKTRIRRISKIVETVLPETRIEGLTNKKGNIRKTVHPYNRVFSGNFGQVREQLVIEATWLGNYEPLTIEKIGSYILDIMQIAGQEALIETYGMKAFNVQALSAERTFCEKIMGLVRFSRMDDPYTALSNKIRHIYDLHLMLGNGAVASFFNSDEFSYMLQKVGKDDFISYRNDNEWLNTHPYTAMIFEEPETTWNRIRNTYRTIFKDLVMGDLPDEKDLIATLGKIGKRMESIVWRI
jgi:hypothetical protein